MSLLDPILPIRLVRRVVRILDIGPLIVRRRLFRRAHCCHLSSTHAPAA